VTVKTSSFPTWAIGLVASTVAVVAMERVALGLFTSFGGLAIVAVAAFLAGTTAAGIAAPDQFARNSSVVAWYIVVLAAIYFLVLPALGGPDPPGARGGPGVYPPPQRGGSPGTYPPLR
jgi:hypothetical protein